MMKLGKHLVKPIISEKSFEVASEGVYVFRTTLSATKGQISEELKKLYDVDEISVNTCIMPGKKKRIHGTRRFTKTSKWKKALVKLKEGQTIDIFPKE